MFTKDSKGGMEQQGSAVKQVGVLLIKEPAIFALNR